MLTSLLAVLLAAVAAAVASPDAIYKLAALDLAERVPPAKRSVTRYLSLHAIPLEDRAKFLQVLTFTINSVSFRSQMIQPVVLGEDMLLVRLDLTALEWDRESRIAKRAELKRRGVEFKFKDAAEEARFEDIWEAFVSKDVYWKVSVQEKGKVVRGWLDPVVEDATRRLSYSSSFILRADWLLPRLMQEKARGGFYSDVLMLPATEADLYKVFLVPIDVVERANQLRFGGAVVDSHVVAIHNREVQLIGSAYGYDEKYIWRTFDFLNDDVPEKNVYQTFGGKTKHDGREIIGSLPNGLSWYYLADAKGKQVDVVPQGIALDMRKSTPDYDRNVVNAYKCVSCHGPVAGIQPFTDDVRKAILNPEIGLAAIVKDKARASGIAYGLEDYYKIADAQGGLARDVVRQQESYDRAIGECNGLTSADNATRFMGYFDQYTWQSVALEQATLEMGVAPDVARKALRYAVRKDGEQVVPNSELVILSTGQPIRRAGWERGFGDAMRAVVWPWEKAAVKAKAY